MEPGTRVRHIQNNIVATVLRTEQGTSVYHLDGPFGHQTEERPADYVIVTFTIPGTPPTIPVKSGKRPVKGKTHRASLPTHLVNPDAGKQTTERWRVSEVVAL